MSKRLYIAIGLLCASGTALAQAYRWVDENGVVHYSDRPQPGAEEIVLPDNTVTTRRVVPPSFASRNDNAEADDEPEEDTGYQSLEIARPGAEETLWNIGGNLDVQLNLQPALKPGHRVRVYFDGEARMVTGTSFTLPEVYRGVHNIQAEIVDQNGQLLIRSQTNRFYIQQTSIAGSNRPGAVPR